jgi:tRNA threonylcarbamoyl adenosine modification protein YjeE
LKKTFKKNDIDAVAAEILGSLRHSESATLVALSGDLGAGKTALSQAVARALGVQGAVISPTFVIMKIYDTKHPAYKRLVHIDAYRLESSSELERLGWRELLADPANLILIEWPEKVPEAIPSGALRVTLSHVNDDEREIELD